MIVSTLIGSLVFAGGLTARLAPAESLDIRVGVEASTGLSVSGDGGSTLSRRSPAALRLGFGVVHPSLPRVQYDIGVVLEVEGRVGVAVSPRIYGSVPLRRVELYALGGVPVLVAPYSLLGVEGGLGVAVPVHRNFAVYAQGQAQVYFWGSDLLPGGALAKIDTAFGVQVRF